MISFSHFTLFVALALLSLCSKAPAQYCSPPSIPTTSCSELSSPSSWPPEKPLLITLLNDDEQPRNLTLFQQSSLSLLNTDHSLSFTFTSNSNDEDDLDGAPSLAFILVTFSASLSSIQSMELPLTCPNDSSQKPLHLHGCDPPPPKPLEFRLSPPNCSSQQYPNDSNETKVSLTYRADAPALDVQAVHHGWKINTTVSLSTTEGDENTSFFVGYITSGEATITAVTIDGNATIDDNANHTKVLVGVANDDNANANHTKVFVGVVVGVTIMAFLIALMIIVISITKRRGRPSLDGSRPAGHGAPPSAPSKAPFPYHDLESSPTPMTKAIPLTPPHTNALEISGSASWLKQPTPR